MTGVNEDKSAAFTKAYRSRLSINNLLHNIHLVEPFDFIELVVFARNCFNASSIYLSPPCVLYELNTTG